MKAVITVTGKDTKGIIAKVSNRCFELGGNIVDISQSVMRDYFAMMMLVEINDLNLPFANFVDEMSKLGDSNGLVIQTMHEEIFDAMHKI